MKRKLPKKSLAILQQFRAELCSIYSKSLESVVLFGSCARGDFHADSDVDILLLFPEGTAIHKETKKVMEYERNLYFSRKISYLYALCNSFSSRKRL